MSTSIIWTDLSHEEQEKRKADFLATASVGDKLLYQGPNQMDQMRYEVVLKDNKKELQWAHSPCNY